MRVRKVVLYLLPLLAVFFVWTGSRENAIGVPLDTLFGPLLDIVGLQLSALLGAVILGGIAHAPLLAGFNRSPLAPRWYLVGVSVSITVVGTWVLWVIGRCCWGFHMAFPDFVIPFLLRIPITESTFYIYSSAYLAMISLSALGGAEIVRAVFVRMG